MRISERQIQKLITIAFAHSANMRIVGEWKNSEEVLELLEKIQNQQSEKLKTIENK